MATFLNTTKLDASNVQAGTLTNIELSASAGIVTSKLATTTPGYVLVGATTTGIPTFAAVSGDMTITGAGVTAIGAGKVTNAMVAAAAGIPYSKLALTGTVVNADISDSAAIAYSKLASLASGNILVGSAGNVATPVAPSGDVTMTNTGVTAIGTNKVTGPMLSTSALLLGYTTRTSNNVASSNTPSEVPLLPLTITVPAGGRSVRLTLSARSMYNDTGGHQSIVSIWKGEVNTGTKIAEQAHTSSGGNAVGSLHLTMIDPAPAAGSITYKIGHARFSTGNSAIEGAVTYPILFMAELV